MIGRAPHFIVNSNGTQPDLLEQIRRLALGSNPRLVDRSRVLDRQERLQDDLAAVARCRSSLLLPLLVLIFHIGIALRGGGGVAAERLAACSRFARRCSRRRRRRPDADAAATAVAAVAAALAAAALCHSLRFAVGLGSMNGVRAVASDSLKVYLNHTGPRGSAARLDNTFCTRFMWLHLYTSDKMFIHLTKMRTRTLHGRWY